MPLKLYSNTINTQQYYSQIMIKSHNSSIHFIRNNQTIRKKMVMTENSIPIQHKPPGNTKKHYNKTSITMTEHENCFEHETGEKTMNERPF